MRAKKRLLIGLLAFVGLCLGLASALWLDGTIKAPEAEAIELERRADFELTDLDGRLRRIDQWNDAVVVINFWATWCPPCRKEIPELVALQEKWGGEGLQLLGVAIDDLRSVQDFIEQQPFNYPVLMAPQQGVPLSQRYGNQVGALPFTVVIDRRQKIRFRHAGPITGAELAPVLMPLLKEKVL